MSERREQEDKIVELVRSIHFLRGAMEQAAAMIDENPALAKLNLRESMDDKRYEFR